MIAGMQRARMAGKRTMSVYLEGDGSPAMRIELQPEPVQRDAAQVQREFIDLANVESLHLLLRDTTVMCIGKQIEVQCLAIANAITCIVSFSTHEALSANFFEPFVAETRAFLSAAPSERAALIEPMCARFGELGALLRRETRSLHTQLIVRPPANATPGTTLINRCALDAFRALVDEIEQLRTLVARQQTHKATAEARADETRVSKRRLFRAALHCTVTRRAEATDGEPQCCVCSRDYSATGKRVTLGSCQHKQSICTDCSTTAERITLGSCQHKQSICTDCFAAASFADSSEGIKTFAHCPFCRQSYQLYSPIT